MKLEEYLAIPYRLVAYSAARADGTWRRYAAYPEIGVVSEAETPWEAQEQLEELRIRYIIDRVQSGLPIPVPRPPLKSLTTTFDLERLGFARWLIDPGNPLLARVTMNRFWQMYFGTGIVKTTEDFGVQGEWPSHPELLDWLATEFIRTGWDVKAMQKSIVTSATYRQSSKTSPELQQRDPENRLLARAPRFRLPAEMVRDQALFVSGLLVVINFAGGEQVQGAFQRMLSLAVVLQLVPFLYMFAALIKFGWTADTKGRYGRAKLLVSGVCGFVTTSLGIALVFFPAQQITSILSYEVWMFGGTAFFVALAAFFFFVYGRKKLQREVLEAAAVGRPAGRSSAR